MAKKLWKVNTSSPAKENKNWLIAVLAKNRGLTTEKTFKEFMHPKLEHILQIKLPQTKIAITKIAKAIKDKEKMIVYSDYDADGISGTAILWETLFDLGADALPYVPHRVREGYGLSTEAIKELAARKVSLIITVDHGVTAKKQIEEAKKLGIDIIVTDHHILPKYPPKPYALIHSLDLCGAGVAWRFCWDLIKELAPNYKEKLLEKLELAALATVADLVPLLGANRAIVKIGLEKLAQTKRPGIKSLICASAINGSIGSYEIGHILAPRINAMGRIEHALDALRLICAKSARQAEELASLLSKTNTKRQDLTTKSIETAIQMVDEKHLVGVLSHDSWHEGIIGLVAARLVETHYRPMIVISRGEVYSKGSARSIPGFNIIEAIRASSDLLVDCGGHPMAAGFTIETQHIEPFTKKINTYAQTILTEKLLTPVINIECELKPQDINLENLNTVEQFEPYGVGNPLPIFLTRKMTVEDVRKVGKEHKHLKLQVSGIGAIGFNFGEKAAEIRPGYLIDLVYTLDKDSYNGANRVQLKIKDLTISS